MRWFVELLGNAPMASERDRHAAMQIRAATVFGLLLCTLVAFVGAMIGSGHGSLVVLVLGAALVALGYAVGLLFALPRSLAASDAAGAGAAAAEQPRSQRLYSINTNLEQVSDWLTKIIVGLSLVEARQIALFVSTSASTLGRGLAAAQTSLPPDTAYSLAMGVLLAFPTLGFLLGFFSIRLYVSRALYVADATILQPIDAVRTLDEAATRAARNVQLAADSRDEPASDEREEANARVSFARQLAGPLPEEPDPALQLATIRIALERAVRRLAEIAGLVDAGEFVNFRATLAALARYGLIQADLIDSLSDVYAVATAAVHGRPIQNDAAAIRASGQRLLDEISQFTGTEKWLASAVECRARRRSKAAVAREEYGADLKVGDVSLEIKIGSGLTTRALAELYDQIAGEDAKKAVVLGQPPPWEVLADAHRRRRMLAWLEGNGFRGIRPSRSTLSWLVDSEVALGPEDYR